jgi:hypothetical protein
MGRVGVKIDIPHCSLGSSDRWMGLNRWSFNALDVSENKCDFVIVVTYLIKAYSLRPSAKGMGVNVPIHPLNLGSELGREGSIVFQVTNIALSSVPSRVISD